MAKAGNEKVNLANQNNHRFEETTAILQQAMATLLQKQALFVSRVEELKDRLDQKFSEFDRRFEHMEALLQQMFKELPEKVFGFRQAAQQKQD